MASMKYYDKHNQVEFLKKPEESTRFAEIVDFLKGSHIRRFLELVACMLPVVIVDQSEGQANQAVDQPSPSETYYETKVPQSQDPTHPHVAEERTMTVDDLLQLVPKLITKVDSLETELKQTKLTMGKALVKLVKKADVEISSKQGRNLQEEGLDEMVRNMMKDKSEVFKTPTQSKTSGEEDISPTTLEAAKTLSKVASQRSNTGFEDINTSFEDISIGFEEVNTGGLRVSTGSGPVSSAIGQREGKAPMIEEETAKQFIWMHLAKDWIGRRRILTDASKAKKSLKFNLKLNTTLKKIGMPLVLSLKLIYKGTVENILVKSFRRDNFKETKGLVKKNVSDPAEKELLYSQGGKESIYQIIRANGADTVYMSFGAMLKDFTREDLIELYRLVMQKYGTNRPEDAYDRVLWSDLRTMFDPPLNEDAIWSLPLQQKMISWRYYDKCAVHCLTLEACNIYMLADRKYPLSKDACQVMLKMKLLDGKMNEVCYKLLKMIEKQAGNKELATQEQTATGKENSNPLIADSLLKTIRLSMHLVNSEADLVDTVTIGIPSLTKDDFTIETIRVEYEWRPPRCVVCKIFGHVYDLCPKKVVSPNVVTPNVVNTSDVPTPTVEKTNDGPSIKQNLRYEPKASTSATKKVVTNVDNASNSSSLLKNIVTSSNQDNIASSNSFSALNVEDDEEEEEVENVYDETTNLFNSQTDGRSFFTVVVG
ncbi:hypothetical protein Tco_1181837 [Tanacetum coccineum]